MPSDETIKNANTAQSIPAAGPRHGVWKVFFLDPRIISSAVAVSLLHLDPQPDGHYRSLTDPFGAAAGSIFFAQLTPVLLLGRIHVLVWLLAFVLSRGAGAGSGPLNIEIMAHLIIPLLVYRDFSLTPGTAAMAGLLGCLLGLGAAWAAFHFGNAFGYPASFCGLASARITIPYFFWSALMVAGRIVRNPEKRRQPSTPFIPVETESSPFNCGKLDFRTESNGKKLTL